MLGVATVLLFILRWRHDIYLMIVAALPYIFMFTFTIMPLFRSRHVHDDNKFTRRPCRLRHAADDALMPLIFTMMATLPPAAGHKAIIYDIFAFFIFAIAAMMPP